MRPLVVEMLASLGVPAWLVPDYAVMVGLAGLLSIAIVLRAARADGDPPHLDARAALWAYAGALIGGYVYEWLRALPDAIATLSLAPLAHAGRAAYGGVLGGLGAVLLHAWATGRSPARFLDRMALALGPTFLLVRTGCFLAGCDYGVPTSSVLGVRHPPGSIAALDHFARGWIPEDAASLPTHPTQLYEGLLALLASGIAWVLWSRRERRAGTVLATWLALYAVSRFSVELLRGDETRGAYAGLSSAQWTSVLLAGASLAFIAQRTLSARRAGPLLATLFVALLWLAPSGASAQVLIVQDPRPAQLMTPLPPGTQPGAVPPYGPPLEPPREDSGPNVRRVTLRLGIALPFAVEQPQGSDGVGFDLSAAYRLEASETARFEIGARAFVDVNRDATTSGVGIHAGAVLQLGRVVEIPLMVDLGIGWIDFKSAFFGDPTALASRFETGLHFSIAEIVVIGVDPLAFEILGGDGLDPLVFYRPRISFALTL